MDPVESIETDVAQIEEVYETEKGKLMTPRGEPYNMPETHERLMAEVEGRRWEQIQATLARHEEHATKKAEATRRQLAPLVGDPITRLPADQLQRAGVLASFIREDCEGLDAYSLRERIEHARDSGDAALSSLWARYGAQRVERERRAAIERGGHPDRDVDDLERTLTALQEGLVDEKTRDQIARLQKELDAMGAVQSTVRLLRERKKPGAAKEFAARMGLDARYVNW